jgi:hypothetical protein
MYLKSDLKLFHWNGNNPPRSLAYCPGQKLPGRFQAACNGKTGEPTKLHRVVAFPTTMNPLGRTQGRPASLSTGYPLNPGVPCYPVPEEIQGRDTDCNSQSLEKINLFRSGSTRPITDDATLMGGRCENHVIIGSPHGMRGNTGRLLEEVMVGLGATTELELLDLSRAEPAALSRLRFLSQKWQSAICLMTTR